MGGADTPEDVQGGFNKALNLKWSADSAKQLFLICDAPGHGRDICNQGDSYPNGSPDGYKIQDQMRQFASMGINFSLIRVNNLCDMMIKVMRECYDSADRQLQVSDLESAIKTKTSVEVTKDFVKAASFILTTALVGKSKKATAKKEPLWDPKKFEVGQYLSQNAYLTVTAIEGNKITV